jgi:hypothetical protein
LVVGAAGRPLLHRDDAGSLLVRYCESLRQTSALSRPMFATFLVPGTFVRFKTFAETVLSMVRELELQEQYGGNVAGGEGGVGGTHASVTLANLAQEEERLSKPTIRLVEQASTPAWLGSKCESDAAVALGFQPRESMVIEGLRDSCAVAWREMATK